jgi:hypothetical protein
MDAHDWLKLGSIGSQAFTFSASVRWAWKHQNLKCLNNETWFLNRLPFYIQSMVETSKSCFSSNLVGTSVNKFVKWSNNNYYYTILNVDKTQLWLLSIRLFWLHSSDFWHYVCWALRHLPRDVNLYMVTDYPWG